MPILDGMAVIADTLKAKKRLVEAGFSDEKAEGIVAIFNEADAQIATKLDLELFRKDMKAEMAELRSDIDARFASVDARFSEMKLLIVKAQLASVTIIVGILSALKILL